MPLLSKSHLFSWTWCPISSTSLHCRSRVSASGSVNRKWWVQQLLPVMFGIVENQELVLERDATTVMQIHIFSSETLTTLSPSHFQLSVSHIISFWRHGIVPWSGGTRHILPHSNFVVLLAPPRTKLTGSSINTHTSAYASRLRPSCDNLKSTWSREKAHVRVDLLLFVGMIQCWWSSLTKLTSLSILFLNDVHQHVLITYISAQLMSRNPVHP